MVILTEGPCWGFFPAKGLSGLTGITSICGVLLFCSLMGSPKEKSLYNFFQIKNSQGFSGLVGITYQKSRLLGCSVVLSLLKNPKKDPLANYYPRKEFPRALWSDWNYLTCFSKSPGCWVILFCLYWPTPRRTLLPISIQEKSSQGLSGLTGIT